MIAVVAAVAFLAGSVFGIWAGRAIQRREQAAMDARLYHIRPTDAAVNPYARLNWGPQK